MDAENLWIVRNTNIQFRMYQYKQNKNTNRRYKVEEPTL